MFVSIRDEIVMTTGFDSLHEALSYFDLRGVEMAVLKDYSIRSLHPTPDKPRLFLNNDADVEILAQQMKCSGIRVTAFLLHNDFNAKDMPTELDWVVRYVQVCDKLGVPAIRIDSIMSEEKTLPLEVRQEIFAKAVQTVLLRAPDYTHAAHADRFFERERFARRG